MDAKGCNYDVCIYVYGHGLSVDEWDSSAFNAYGVDECTYAAYWGPPDTIIATTNEVCGDGDFASYWQGPLQFYGDIEVCNTWVHFPGKPCEWVHS